MSVQKCREILNALSKDRVWKALSVAEKIGEGFARLRLMQMVHGNEKGRAKLRQRLAMLDEYFRRQNGG